MTRTESTTWTSTKGVELIRLRRNLAEVSALFNADSLDELAAAAAEAAAELRAREASERAVA